MKMSEFDFQENDILHQGINWTPDTPYCNCAIMHGKAVKQLFIDAGRDDFDMSDIDNDALYRVEDGQIFLWGDR